MDCQIAVSVGKALTLDLNGKIVKVKIVPEAKAKQTISAFAVSESVTFTILNGLLGGSGKDADNRAIEANGGTVILRRYDSGRFSGVIWKRRRCLDEWRYAGSREM